MFYLTASNIDFSDILETPSYVALPPWCIRQQPIVLDLVHLKKDRTDASVYLQLFMEIRDRCRDYVPVYTDESRDGNYVAYAALFPSDTVISMILPDSPSLFIAEIWAIIKAQEEIKNASSTKYIVFTNSLSSLQASQYIYKAGISLDWDGDMKVCRLFYFPIKTLFFVGHPTILALGVTKWQTLLPNLLWSCLKNQGCCAFLFD